MLEWINKKRNKKGFTLVELVVVIAILGILAAIAIPRLSGSRANAERKAIVSSLRTIDSALSIAEADGATITDMASVVKAGYLAAEPKSTNTTFKVEERILDGDIKAKRGVVSMTSDQAKNLDVGIEAIGTAEKGLSVEELQALATHGSKFQ